MTDDDEPSPLSEETMCEIEKVIALMQAVVRAFKCGAITADERDRRVEPLVERLRRASHRARLEVVPPPTEARH
jgi:hypothetical protein